VLTHRRPIAVAAPPFQRSWSTLKMSSGLAIIAGIAHHAIRTALHQT